jgi:hypothetical protein
LDVRCLAFLAECFAASNTAFDILKLVSATNWQMPQSPRSQDTLHAMVIDAVVRYGNCEQALEIAQGLQRRGFKIKPETFVSMVLVVCQQSSKNNIELATEAFRQLSAQDKCHHEVSPQSPPLSQAERDVAEQKQLTDMPACSEVVYYALIQAACAPGALDVAQAMVPSEHEIAAEFHHLC